MKYDFICRNAGKFSVRRMCDVLGVSASGYYDARDRPKSATALRRDALAERIRTIHAAKKGRYGSPRIHAELVDARETWCINAVAKAMKSLGIQAISHRKFRVSTTDSNHEFPVAGNVLDRNFTATKPNEVWLADMTDIPTAEGFLYLSIVEICFRGVSWVGRWRAVAWSMRCTWRSSRDARKRGCWRTRIAAVSMRANTTNGNSRSTGFGAA